MNFCKSITSFTVAVLLIVFGAASVFAATIVVIDPAHGGDDIGVEAGSSAKEKDIVLKIARYVQEDLNKSAAFNVKMTRSDDRNLSNEARQKFAQDLSPATFVSIHINAGFDENTAGFEIYCLGFTSGANGQKDESKAIMKDMQRNRYINDSVKLASSLEKALSDALPRKSRGVQQTPSVILKDLKLPAAVVEIGFVSNSEEIKNLLKEDEQRRVGKAIAKGIRNALK